MTRDEKLQVIGKAMEAKGLSSYRLAKIMGVSAQAVGNWRCGQNLPYSQLVPLIAEVLEIDPESIL